MPGGNPGVPQAESGHTIWTRRELASVAGWGAILACFAIAGGAIVRLLFPRVLFEPPTSFKAGRPEEYAVGAVSERWMKTQRVWIIRNNEMIYALLAICTHLGCTPRWLAPENKFKCPCHGSGYTKDGINFEGPTPRPLERVRITLGDDGGLIVDKAFRYRYELGQWSDPQAFVKYGNV
jgi:cytochrome b6-f complex iron-sulfur subunit